MDDYFDLAGFAAAALREYPHCAVYGLADHGGMAGLHAQLSRSSVAWHSLFEGSREANALAVAPLLFSLTDACNGRHRQLLDWVAAHGTYTSSLLMLASPLAIDDVASRLARRLDATLSEDMNVMLRFFDPRVFEALVQALEPVQREAFLDVADGWWYFDRRGALVPQPASCAAQDGYVAPLRLTAAQEFALLASSEPDQVAEQLQTMVPEPWRDVALPRRVAFLQRHIAAANALGLRSTRDLALYCAAALLEGEDFASTPKWRPLLAQVQRGELDFGAALAR